MGGTGELFHEVLCDAVEESADYMSLHVMAGTAHAGTKQQVHVLICLSCTARNLAEQQSMSSQLQKL